MSQSFAKTLKSLMLGLGSALVLAACGGGGAVKPEARAPIATAKSSPAEAGATVPAEALAPADPAVEAQFTQALDYMASGDLTNAELELEQLTLSHPSFAGPFVNLAIIYMGSDRLDEASRALEQALAVNPTHQQAYNQQGILQRRQGRFADAEQSYRDALAIDPNYALAHFNLGVLLDLYMGRSEEALSHYQRYREIEPDGDQRVNNWIVDLSRRLGVEVPQTRVAQEGTDATP